MNKIAGSLCFGGEQLRFEHHSAVLDCSMKFSLFLPPATNTILSPHGIPLLYWLSGLTCTDENFVHKAGAQRIASELGMAIVVPDTSPRGEQIPDAPDGAYDLGLGAGFYLNATQAPWQRHYRMYDYIADELPALLAANFRFDPAMQSIAGHSMGGHGALVLALRNPERYRSVSAFAPICAPSESLWGQKAFTAYLGADQHLWRQYDATELIAHVKRHVPMLIDQGSADQFLESQLKPELLLAAAGQNDYPLTYRNRPGYDHSYFYIASFIEEHLRFHHIAMSRVRD